MLFHQITNNLPISKCQGTTSIELRFKRWLMECSQISVYFKISGFSKMNRIDWTSDQLVGPYSIWPPYELLISSMCTDIEEEVKSKYILHWSYRQYTAVPEELEHHGTHVEEIYLRENSILILVS